MYALEISVVEFHVNWRQIVLLAEELLLVAFRVWAMTSDSTRSENLLRNPEDQLGLFECQTTTTFTWMRGHGSRDSTNTTHIQDLTRLALRTPTEASCLTLEDPPVASNLVAMASNPMASNLVAMASNLIAASNLAIMASNLIAVASNLVAMASNLIAVGDGPADLTLRRVYAELPREGLHGDLIVFDLRWCNEALEAEAAGDVHAALKPMPGSELLD